MPSSIAVRCHRNIVMITELTKMTVAHAFTPASQRVMAGRASIARPICHSTRARIARVGGSMLENSSVLRPTIEPG